MTVSNDLAYAEELDAQDTCAHFRERFLIEDDDLIYMDGNSLGRLPYATVDQSADLVRQQWGSRLIRSWNEGWFTAPERIGAKIASLIGAQADEVIVADSTSVNLFKLVVAALRFQVGRSQIVTDDLNFPSDLYILQGAIDMLDKQHQLQVVPSVDGIDGPVADLRARLDEQTALLTLSHTVFKSGYMYDMAALTSAAHDAGALVLWDLSHSVGAVPVDLNAANVDLAIGCTYKYLNGGPGAPAFLYIRRDLQERLINPLTGWMGQQNLFGFDLKYQPAPGLRRFLTGTPPVVSLSLIEPGVDLLREAGIEQLRAKSLRQSSYLIDLWEAELEPLGFTLKSPREQAYRGSHISLGHAEGLRIDLALINDMHVLPDFRAPDNIRLGITPLYTTYRDIHQTVQRLKHIVVERLYERYPTEAPIVT
ncbi:kynureninase [Dictyobacter formicarum]|uniref:Kynureninase n=1 Tax=Dictyobacter formicarum TaxID=2778368 RepID=A0ABQ3VSP1_9CHLR|nr:kynureninase [Dictyobacter formicarum]GHO88830.1 kynureninase [Dictyobacter formicarum]